MAGTPEGDAGKRQAAFRLPGGPGGQRRVSASVVASAGRPDAIESAHPRGRPRPRAAAGEQSYA
ncbi:MAG: hypothetical protein ACRDRM_12495 [Pseudonocardiaceae bacterium]